MVASAVPNISTCEIYLLTPARTEDLQPLVEQVSRIKQRIYAFNPTEKPSNGFVKIIDWDLGNQHSVTILRHEDLHHEKSESELQKRICLPDRNSDPTIMNLANELNGHKIDEFIERYLKNTIPSILPPDRLNFTLAAKREHRCQLDSEMFVDEKNWALTLADTFPFQTSNTKTWGGHACIFIEGIEAGEYFIKKAELGSEPKSIDCCGSGTGMVLFSDLTKKVFDGRRIADKSETWSVPRINVQKMINEIERENRKEIPVLINPRGRDPIGSPQLIAPQNPESQRILPDNCFTWSFRKLSLAGIYLYPSLLRSPGIVNVLYLKNNNLLISHNAVTLRESHQDTSNSLSIISGWGFCAYSLALLPTVIGIPVAVASGGYALYKTIQSIKEATSAGASLIVQAPKLKIGQSSLFSKRRVIVHIVNRDQLYYCNSSSVAHAIITNKSRCLFKESIPNSERINTIIFDATQLIHNSVNHKYGADQSWQVVFEPNSQIHGIRVPSAEVPILVPGAYCDSSNETVSDPAAYCATSELRQGHLQPPVIISYKITEQNRIYSSDASALIEDAINSCM